jgi:hypothetical protein
MKPRVIYIAGSGFSGSTFLDMLLGSLPRIHGLGEMMYLPHYVLNGVPCMCGHHLAACRTWGVLSDFLGQPEHAVHFGPRFHHDVLYNALNEPEYFRSDEVRRYAATQAGIIDAICARRGVDIVIDSSKNLPRLRMYDELLKDRVELVAVHLLRNPFDQALSEKKNYQSGFTFDRRELAYVRLNSRIRRYLRRAQVRHCMLFYKDLCDDPVGNLNRILRFVRLPEVAGVPESRDGDYHQIEGNPGKVNFGKIRYSTAWRRELSLKGGLVCAPNLAYYAYLRCFART